MMQLRKPNKYGLFVSIFETNRDENRQILAKKLLRNKFIKKQVHSTLFSTFNVSFAHFLQLNFLILSKPLAIIFC